MLEVLVNQGTCKAQPSDQYEGITLQKVRKIIQSMKKTGNMKDNLAIVSGFSLSTSEIDLPKFGKGIIS